MAAVTSYPRSSKSPSDLIACEFSSGIEAGLRPNPGLIGLERANCVLQIESFDPELLADLSVLRPGQGS